MNIYKREMDSLTQEIKDHEEVLWELEQNPALEADRRQVRETFSDLQTELAHFDIARTFAAKHESGLAAIREKYRSEYEALAGLSEEEAFWREVDIRQREDEDVMNLDGELMPRELRALARLDRRD